MGKKRELRPGEKLGRWTLLAADAGSDPPRWRCRCDCGQERSVLARSLIYGLSQSCGCLKTERAVQKKRHALAGQRFGSLTVLEEAPRREGQDSVTWRCRCDCGREVCYPGSLLATGKRSHCGCKTNPRYAYKNIRGQKFGRLTALEPLEKRDRRGNVMWRCRCDCGQELELTYNVLAHSTQRSCGCLAREQAGSMRDELALVDGTLLDSFRSSVLRSDNTTGVKGVYRSHGRYMAKIVFQKKQYHLGYYRDLAEAAFARELAEKQIREEILPAYEKWKRRAKADPAWAEENPVRLSAERDGDNAIFISFTPNMDDYE